MHVTLQCHKGIACGLGGSWLIKDLDIKEQQSRYTSSHPLKSPFPGEVHTSVNIRCGRDSDMDNDRNL